MLQTHLPDHPFDNMCTQISEWWHCWDHTQPRFLKLASAVCFLLSWRPTMVSFHHGSRSPQLLCSQWKGTTAFNQWCWTLTICTLRCFSWVVGIKLNVKVRNHEKKHHNGGEAWQMGEGSYENCFATSGNLFCTCHLEKRGEWMVMGHVRLFFEKKGGARKYSATPGMFLQRLWGVRIFFATLVPHPQD